MELKNPVSGKQTLFPGAAVLLLAAMLIFACNKAKETIPSKTDNDNIEAAVKAVTSNVVWGKLTTTPTDEGVLLQISDLDIIVESKPGTDLSGLPDISSAVVITSKHGLILKDALSNRLYFLVNDDRESIRHFTTFASYLPPAERNDLIFGTTIVKIFKG